MLGCSVRSLRHGKQTHGSADPSHLIWHPEVLYCVAPYVGLRYPPEAVAVLHALILSMWRAGVCQMPKGGIQSALFWGRELEELRCRRLTFEVQMTSRSLTFIQLSHCTMWPLYVSPFFSSTSCIEMTSLQQFLSSATLPEHVNSQIHAGLTTACFSAVRRSTKGSMKPAGRFSGSRLRLWVSSTSVSVQVSGTCPSVSYCRRDVPRCRGLTFCSQNVPALSNCMFLGPCRCCAIKGGKRA